MDAFSQRFITALQKRLPQLLEYLRETPDREAIQLTSKAPSGRGDLFITTQGEEVTVAFGPWHQHFDEQEYWLSAESDDDRKGEAFERPLTLIADLLRDLVV